MVEYNGNVQISDINRILETEIVEERDRIDLVNPGFQKPGRTRSYEATQKYVVGKSPLLDKAISLIEERHSLKVLEFGIGTGVVIEHLAEKGLLRKINGFEYTGLDISPEMISCTTNVINEQIKAGNIREDSKFALVRGVNLLNPSWMFSGLLPKQSYDIIICSQFEHYFPNERDSTLASKLKKDFMTKREFRENSFELLNNGGMYIVLNDRTAEEGHDSNEQRKLDYAWDKSVALNFLNPKVIEDIAKTDPEIAERIRYTYNTKRPLAEAIELIKMIRIKRRNECNEETEKLSKTLDDLKSIYGNAGYEVHPSLNNFYLAWARKI